MPISEDEYDSQTGFPPEGSASNNLSKAELRKTNKPIMEKKRRARINNCLNELKDLLLEAMKKDPARHSKLEKADILELTVKHLQALQRQQLAAAVAADPAVLLRFRAGFGDCAVEVKRYLSRLGGVPSGLRNRLGNHLSSCLSGLERLGPLPLPDFPSNYASPLDPNPMNVDLEDGIKKRLSAFHYVKGPNKLNSPPLSPISCDSACDSSTEPETPPRIPSLFMPPTSAFPTPPSRTSHSSEQDSSPETQKATISSTTISPESKLLPASRDIVKAKTYEPLSIVIDVDNYDCKDSVSPKSAVDYSTTSRHNLKRPSQLNISDRPTKLQRTVISHAALSKPESLSSKNETMMVETKQESKLPEANVSSSSSSSNASNADMWRPW